MADDASKIVFVETHEFWWPVTVQMPADGGQRTERAFEARLRMMPDDDLFGRGDAAADDPLGAERAVVERAVVDWRPSGSGQKPAWLPDFSAEALRQAIAYSPWRRAFVRALLDSHHGSRTGDTARVGN